MRGCLRPVLSLTVRAWSEKVDLPELFKRADFITPYTPLTDKTKNIVDAAAIVTHR
jgi:phosphoglycerate dehydrogenase-like enzyme